MPLTVLCALQESYCTVPSLPQSRLLLEVHRNDRWHVLLYKFVMTSNPWQGHCYSEGEFWLSILKNDGECFDGKMWQTSPNKSSSPCTLQTFWRHNRSQSVLCMFHTDILHYSDMRDCIKVNEQNSAFRTWVLIWQTVQHQTPDESNIQHLITS